MGTLVPSFSEKHVKKMPKTCKETQWLTIVNSQLIFNRSGNIHNPSLFIKLLATARASLACTIKTPTLARNNTALHWMQILCHWNKHWVDSRKWLIKKQQGIADGIHDNWMLTHMYLDLTACCPKSSLKSATTLRDLYAASQSQRQRIITER